MDVSYGVYPSFTSDDFAFYTEKIKGCYFGFDLGKSAGILHSSKYDFDDKAIPIIANIWEQLAFSLLKT